MSLAHHELLCHLHTMLATTNHSAGNHPPRRGVRTRRLHRLKRGPTRPIPIRADKMVLLLRNFAFRDRLDELRHSAPTGLKTGSLVNGVRAGHTPGPF